MKIQRENQGKENPDAPFANESLLQGKSPAHWGSDIQTHPDFERSKRGHLAHGPDFKCDMKSGSRTI